MLKTYDKVDFSYKYFVDFKPVNDEFILEMLKNYIRRMAKIKGKSCSEGTINCYLSCIKRYAKNNKLSVVELYNAIHKHIEKYFLDKENNERAISGHHSEISALKKLGEFKNYMDNLDEIIGKYKSLDEHLKRLEAEQENKFKCIQPTFHKSGALPDLSQNDLSYYSTAKMNVVQQDLAQDKDKGKTFFEVLSAFIDAKHIKDSDCYKKAGVSKQSFSDYRGGTIPETEVIIRFALALDLDLDETERLLRAAGRAFSFEPRDRFIVACIKAGIKDVDDVNEALYDFGYKTFQFVKEK